MRSYLPLALLTIAVWSCTKMDVSDPGLLTPATTVEDSRLPALDINGVRLHLETMGDIHQPILIFVHGGPGGDYRPFISEVGEKGASAYPEARNLTNGGLSRLQDQYFCVFFDQRGAGLSPRFDPGKVGFYDNVADIDAIVDHFLKKKADETGIVDTQVNIFGWSFGGYLSTAYVNAHPDKVRDVVLYEPRPFTQEAFDLLTLTSPFQQLTEEYVDEFISGNTYLLPNDHNAIDYQQTTGMTGNFFPEFNNPQNLPFWRQGAVVGTEVEREIQQENFDITGNLPQFKGRLLFLYGSKSKADAVKPGYFELMTSYYPQAQTVEISDTGHAGIWEKSAEVVDAIQLFL